MLQRTACSAFAKAIMNPSPWLFTTCPERSLTSLRTSLSCSPDQLDPGPVADPFVEREWSSSISENRIATSAVRGDPGQVRALHLGPIGEIFDRAAHRGAEPLFAHQVRGLPRRFDRLPAAGP